jgi:hypothetical protein
VRELDRAGFMPIIGEHPDPVGAGTGEIVSRMIADS